MNPMHTFAQMRDVSEKPTRTLAVLLILMLLLAGCATKPKTVRIESIPPANELLSYALSFQGTPYSWGKSSPEEGFDCSGFVWYVYRQFGYQLPRTAEQMANYLPEVEAEQRKPGDLLFFDSNEKQYSHVGLYLGDDAFIHASSSKGGVIISNMNQPYWQEHLVGVRRPAHGDGAYATENNVTQ